MGLHDRLKTSNGNAPSRSPTSPACRPARSRRAPRRRTILLRAEDSDPHACIATLGAELFKREATGDLTERVTRAVTEQLVLDRTPLTREERRQIIREITDDILGYGPLEPFLRDDSVTEVMCNRHDQIYIERDGKIERTQAAFADNSHLLRIIDKIVSQVGRRVDEASPMVDARLPDGSRRERDHPAARAQGPDADDPEVLPGPVHDDDLITFGTISLARRSSSRPA
jgi:pilus assembly protein CpaF